MSNKNFPILKNTTPSTSEKNLNFINEMISNTLFNRKTNGEINLHEFSSKAKTFRSYDKFLDADELDTEKLKEIKAFMNSVDKLEPIRDGLICWLDGRDGNNNDRTTIWKDRSGNGNDATLVGFDFNENSGWGDGFLKFDGIKNYVNTNLGEVGDWTVEVNIHVLDKANQEHYVWSRYKTDATPANRGGLTLNFPDNREKSAFYHAYSGSRHVCYFENMSNLTNKHSVLTVVRENGITKLYTNGILKLNYNSDPQSFGELDNVRIGCYGPNSTPQLFFKGKMFSFTHYSRALTPEEVRHNYLYDLSVQYLLKNQVNSNTIETYYGFDPNYDLPDNRIEGCLMVSNGRLVYYNPSGSAPLRIANNKTLDECIVEETEDYIIYSDGEATPDNPIPEGIYFACRVDKHTGEIYYGEGYENLARTGPSSLYVTREDLYHKYTMFKKIKHQNENAWGFLVRHQFSKTDIVNYSTHVLFSSLKSTTALRGSLGYNGGFFSQHIYKLLGDNYTGFYEFRGLKATGEPNSLESINIDMHQGAPTNSEVHLKNVMVTKNTKTNLFYTFTKIPHGKVEFNRKTTGIDGLSLLFKSATNFKEENGDWTGNNWLCWLNYDGNRGRLVSSWIPKLNSNDLYISKLAQQGLSLSSVPDTNGTYKTTGIKIAGIISDTRRTNIIKAFIFYSGELTNVELEAEKNKTFRLKKFYRTNTNQSSFLGLEDISTNNNTKEIIDGTIIDTTKTPIEYKEQKDISKTSDITSYTKNNINIEKSKCGYIRDIRNTNDFKNLPNNLVAEPIKYDEKYQSPTVNILSILREWGGGLMGSDEVGDFFYKTGEPWTNGMAMDLNKDIKLNQTYTWIWELMVMEPTVTGKSYSLDVNSNPLIEGSNDKGHVTPDGISGFTLPETIGQWRRYQFRVNTIEHPRDLFQVVLCPRITELVNKKIYYRNIQILEGDFRDQNIDYTPPNSDGNFIPTIGESGIFSVKQTTKDTDKNTDTFARTIFLP
ncbi:MAG: LamG-like jellyroll fold domain-containing protein [Sarcina sp.]